MVFSKLHDQAHSPVRKVLGILSWGSPILWQISKLNPERFTHLATWAGYGFDRGFRQEIADEDVVEAVDVISGGGAVNV